LNSGVAQRRPQRFLSRDRLPQVSNALCDCLIHTITTIELTEKSPFLEKSTSGRFDEITPFFSGLAI
jgi:hypothetical protein